MFDPARPCKPLLALTTCHISIPNAMRILPTGGSLFKKRSRKVRRQELIGAGPAPDDVETNEVALP